MGYQWEGSQFTDILTSSGGTLANDTLTLREVMGNSSFSFDLFQEDWYC